LSGAADQVTYVYKKLGGDILDIEITEGSVYSAYEESVLEYSYLVNIHQATNILSDTLGNTTGSFDSKGNILPGTLSSSLGGKHVALKYPKFDYGMTRRIGEGISSEIGLMGSEQFSGSFAIKFGQQDYDLQKILEAATNTSATGSLTFTAAPADEEKITLIDASGTSQEFTFDRDTNDITNATIGILAASGQRTDALKASVTATQTAATINAHAIGITATASDAKVTLTQDVAGSPGNTTITDGASEMTATDFTSGDTTYLYADKIKGKKILIKKVFYKTPHAMWRFFGYYGGLNVVGNLHNYGQFSDDSTFQLIPTWHNKAQALAFEDAIYTRMSHFSYELRGNKIRLHPRPYTGGPRVMWVEFSIPQDSWDNDDLATDGVNNLNTLPIGNLPFENINSIGKQWIRRFALALSKEVLGQVRSKFGTVPIPGDSVTLNGSDLLTQAKDEQDKLREELKTTLAELTYAKMAESDAGMQGASTCCHRPYFITPQKYNLVPSGAPCLCFQACPRQIQPF
jgi:hypothetical protein